MDLKLGTSKVTVKYTTTIVTTHTVNNGVKTQLARPQANTSNNEATIDITVLDEKQEVNELEETWKNIPSKDASADEIRDFIQSAVKHKDETGEDKFSEVTLKTLQSWQKTIEALGMDQIQNYNDEYWKICARIRRAN